MFLAIQTAIDLANLIIAEKGYPRPSSYKEAFEILNQEKFIRDKEITNCLRQLASFRNILVHQNPRFNQEKAYKNLKDGLDPLKIFQKVVAHYALNK